jgi:NAD(P)-dependent dehydrogenase (short-subunit alcohol dehydrogenase family)
MSDTPTMESLFDLSGRVALITGGRSGIGRMLAEGLIKAGVKVYISSSKAEACDAAAKELGENCISLPADVSSEAGAVELVKAYSKHESRLDILINNAGTVALQDFSETSEESWDKLQNVNVKGPFFLTQKFHDLLKASADTLNKPSKVINVCSIEGISVNALENYAYHGTKAAMVHLTRRMAARLIEDNIVVNGISPGAFASEMNMLARKKPEISAAWNPSKRIGTPEDIVGTAIFLCSRAGDYIVGQNLVVDGGLTSASFRPPGKIDSSLTS